jgi:DNA-directed RNA polymerase sigma subunit (sigma70/sigma32)
MSIESFIDKIGCHQSKINKENVISIIERALMPLHKKKTLWNADNVKEMLILRYGLEGYEEHTLRQLGVGYNRSAERVRFTEAKALRMIRSFLYREYGTEDLNNENI